MRFYFKTINFFLLIASLSFSVTDPSIGQILSKNSFRLDVGKSEAGLLSNSITDVVVFGNRILFGTSSGLSRTSDEGFSFETFDEQDGLGKGGVSALTVSDEITWVATGFDSTTDVGVLDTGGGLAYTLDDGLTWNFVPQPGVTPVQNITFDIALRGEEVWITSFGGGLRKSDNLGTTWEIVTPDSFIFDPGNRLNHRAFSVINVDGTLWVGTAGGINRSTDGGLTWTNFNHANQEQPISGNFVVAIANQKYRNRDIIWAATVQTDTSQFRGVSWSEDQGFNWRTTLRGAFAHNFAFDDSVVYVVSDKGLFKSIDFGETWAKFPDIINPSETRRVFTNEFFAAGVSDGHTLWVGGPDGLAKTSNNGITWEVFQAFRPTGRDAEPRTYAYPNPFSPRLHNKLNGDGHVRFQYNTVNTTRVTLKIYDFSMQHVATVVENFARPPNGDFYETWDGLNSNGQPVANGVYFYRLDLEADGSFWGKLIVMN